MTNAVLIRDIPLAVREVSSGGCLIESSVPMQIGTIGWLEVEYEGQRRSEWFRVARVERRDDRVFVAGVEFLPLGAAGADSLRSTIGRLRRSARSPGGQMLPGRSTRHHHREAGAVSPSESYAGESCATILDFSRRRS
jgi:hypothetical protein